MQFKTSSSWTGTQLASVSSSGWILVSHFSGARLIAKLVSILPAEPAAVYEIQLVAFNGNGEGPSTRRLVSLADGGNAAEGRSSSVTLDHCLTPQLETSGTS